MQLNKSYCLGVCLAATAACGAPPSPTPASVGPAWHEDVIYQVFPRSFQDSDGDGLGDLAGVTERVPYLHDLGVNVVWLNPIYPSGHVDSGYDVSDFTGIDPQFGTLQDFHKLANSLHSHGMKLLLDLVLNHTSDQHPWFAAEVARKRLQHHLAELIAQSDAVEGAAIIDLMVDPGSGELAQGPHVAEAKKVIATYMEHDDKKAEEVGYPAHVTNLHRLADSLEACVGRDAHCHGLAMPEDDFYIWRDKPNNWTSIFSGSVWRPIDDTGGYCMHLFSEHQIDLNWRNPEMRQAMGVVAATWQSRGVDGFRMDSIGSLSKDPRFPYDPGEPGVDGRGMQFYNNLPEVHRYIREFIDHLKPDARTVGEVAFNRIDAPLDYAGISRHEVNQVFVFDQVGLDMNHTKWRRLPPDMSVFKRIMADQQKLIHGRAWLGNYLENHDQLRIVSRYGDPNNFRETSAEAFGTLLMTLEGTPFIYQGQELGMTDLPPHTFPSIDDVEDVEGRNWYYEKVGRGEEPNATYDKVTSRCRDNVRSAMQWTDAANAGFTKGTTKVRVNPNYTSVNAASEAKEPHSVFATYKKLIELRRKYPEWIVGSFDDMAPSHPKAFCYRRSLEDRSSWVLINLSSDPQDVTLDSAFLPHAAAYVVYSNTQKAPALSRKMHLAPWQATVYATQQ